MERHLRCAGKAGTGKTTLTASLARLDFPKLMLDADVDAANLSMLTGAKGFMSEKFIDGQTAEIDSETCIACGICHDKCRFDAIIPGESSYSVDLHSCEGCGVCKLVCPQDAVTMSDSDAGTLLGSETPYGLLLHGNLSAGRDNSGKMVTRLREIAKEKAKPGDTILIDGPPGIGCQTIAALTGVDYVIVVTEPSLSAIHDMERLFDLIDHFGINSGVVLNRYDINKELSERIRDIAAEKNSSVLCRIPFDRRIYSGITDGITPFEIDADYRAKIKTLYDLIP